MLKRVWSAFVYFPDEKTQGLMGVTETIVCTSISGMLFSLFCGQPLLLIGPTGPVLVFEQSLYNVSLTLVIFFWWSFHMGGRGGGGGGAI